MKSRFNWTPESVETLKKLAADGWSCSLIGDELGGVTKNAVVGKLHRLGIKFKETKLVKSQFKNEPVVNTAKSPKRPEQSKRPQQHTQHSFGTILIHSHNKFKPGSDQLYADLAKAAANTLVLQKKLAKEA